MKQSMANLVPMRAVPRLDTGTLGYCLSVLILTTTGGLLLAQSPGRTPVYGRNPVTPSNTGGVKALAAPKGESDDDTPLNYNRAFPLPPGVKPKLPFKPISAPIILPGAIQTGQAFEGIDFLGSSCGCLPPDTDAAVGNNYVVEAVNVQLRVFDKTTGNILLDEPLATLFGASTGGDPYVVYDDTANRWYVSAFDSTDTGLFLAVSKDSNPLDGFLTTYHLDQVGGFPDYQKMGYNKDAIFIAYNDYGSASGNAAIAAIDKAAALSGTLTYYVSSPQPQYRAMPPAQMHGDTTGGIEWFVSTDGTDSGGNTIRVTKMVNYLSSSPTFTYTSLPVTQYGQASFAEQPGGTVTVFPNTTTTQVHYRHGHLVTAMASAQAGDGFVYPKGLYYQVDISGGTPALLKQGVIDPGTGVAVQMASADEDAGGILGLTWMESSISEYLSMWVGSVDQSGTLTASVAAPGGGFFTANNRIGDYSTIVIDSADNSTFWAANEYIGPDGDTDFWRTHITSFSVGMAVSTTTPANGAIVATPPTQYIIGFNAPYDPSAVNFAGVSVNGFAASSFTPIDNHTISVKFAANPVTTQGLQHFNVAAGTVKRLSDGNPLAAYTSTFRYDQLRMQVVSTVPANGSVATLPLTSMVVTLNEACDPTSVDTSDLALSVGSVKSVQVVDTKTIKFLLSGITVEGTLYFAIPAGAFTDGYGNPSLPYQGSVTLDYDTVALPLPLAAQKPAGALIYKTGYNGNIFPKGDTDTFTLQLDPGQTITVIVQPIDPSLQPMVTLNGNGFGSGATAPAPNKAAVIQTVQTAGALWGNTAPMTYKITVGGAAKTTGHYNVVVVLNAAAELEEYDGPSDDSRATAQSLEGSFITLDSTAQVPQRGAVFGNIKPGIQAGDAWVSVRSFGFFGGNVVRYNANGDLVQTIDNPAFANGVISDIELGPGENVYVALCTDFTSPTVKGAILKFDLNGKLLANIPVPDDPANIGYLYPFGFDVAPDGTLWVAQLNAGNVVHLDATGNLIASYGVGLQPQDVSVNPSGKVFISFLEFNTFTPAVLLLDPSNGNVTDFSLSVFNPVELNATPDGGLWLGDIFDALKLDNTGAPTLQIFEYPVLDAQQDPSGGPWIAEFFNGLTKYDASGNFLFQRFPPDGYPLGVAVAGIDSTDPLPPQPTDYYSFSLKPGQTATLVLTIQQGSTATAQFQDPSGNVIAQGIAASSQDWVTPIYTAAMGGTYYVKITGDAQYNLVVLRNSDFNLGGSSSIATAQPLIAPSASVAHRALGYVASGSVDFSGGFGNADGLMANGSATFLGNLGRLTDGGFGEAGSIFTTYRVGVAEFSTTFTFSIVPGTLPMADGLTFTLQGDSPSELGPSGGGLGYGPDNPFASPGIRKSVAVKFDIYDNAGEGIDSTGLFTDGHSPTIALAPPDVVVDLTGTGIDLSSQDLFQVNLNYDGATLTATIVDTVTHASAGQTYSIDIPGQVGDQTGFVGFTGGTGGLASIQDIHAWTYTSSQAVADFYRVQLVGNKTVFISTSTPAGGAGQFVNGLDPMLWLFDHNGNQVAVDDNSADGRNAKITYKVLPGAGGDYYIAIAPSTATPKPTRGEYILMQSQ
jgi:hypothetical protein